MSPLHLETVLDSQVRSPHQPSDGSTNVTTVDEITTVADAQLKTLLQSGKAQEAKQYVVALASLINTDVTTTVSNVASFLNVVKCDNL